MLQQDRELSSEATADAARRDGHATAPRGQAAEGAIDALHLADLIGAVRDRFALPADLTDARILQSLEEIAAKSDPRARWRAAFSSPIAETVSRRGCDLSTVIGALLALLPKPVS